MEIAVRNGRRVMHVRSTCFFRHTFKDEVLLDPHGEERSTAARLRTVLRIA
jgi:hypothetical protein